MGLIYAGMCAAILFGKVNRVQSHAHVTFANVACLQYEDVDADQFVDDDSSDSDCDDALEQVVEEEEAEEENTSEKKTNKYVSDRTERVNNACC